MRSGHISGFTASDVLHDAYVRLVQDWSRVPREPGFVPYACQQIRWRVGDFLDELERRRRIVERYLHSGCSVSERGEEVPDDYVL